MYIQEYMCMPIVIVRYIKGSMQSIRLLPDLRHASWPKWHLFHQYVVE